MLTPRQVILWLMTALDFEIMLTERRESIDQQVSREDSMKQSTSTSPKNQTSRTNSPSVGEFFSGPIELVYVNSLPPRGRFVHGSSVEFFFENGELAVRGDIIQIAPKEEAFYLALDRTLGLDYWRSELVQRQGEPVIRATNLATDWRNQGLEAVLIGPREVRFYTKDGPEITRGRVAAVEIIAKRAPKQRVLLVASEDDPGDVTVITPSDDYDKMVSKLVALEERHGD